MTFFSQVKLNLGKATVLLGLGLSSIFLSTAYANSPKVLTTQEQTDLMAKGMWYDERTGLIWDRCSLGQTWNGSTCTGQVKTYDWQDAHTAIKNLNQQNHRGYNDWSLPTLMQLHSLVHCSTAFKDTRKIYADLFAENIKVYTTCINSYQRPTINQAIFPNTADELYWSSSPDMNNMNNRSNNVWVWGVPFYDGSIIYANKNNSYYVRAVRSVNSLGLDAYQEVLYEQRKAQTDAYPAEKERKAAEQAAEQAKIITEFKQKFAANPSQTQADLMAKGLWYDERTGLIWSRCSVGLTWNGVACTGELKKFTWAEANQFLQSYSLNGYSGWRIPSHSEFQTLRDCNAVAPKGNDERTYRTQIYDNEEYYHCGDIYDKDKKSRTSFAFIQPSMGWNRTSYWTSTINDVGRDLFWMNKNSRDGVELGHGHFCPVDDTDCKTHLFLVNDTYFLGSQSIKNIFLAIKNEEGKTITEQRKIKEEKARIEAEERAKAEAKARKEQQAYDRKVAAFRKNLKVGDDTSDGLVIEIKGNLIKIQTYDKQCSQRDYKNNCINWINTPVEKWLKRSHIYPED